MLHLSASHPNHPSSAITLTPSPGILLPPNGNKDTVSRLTAYAEWLADQGSGYWDVDLVAYRDHLYERGLASTTVQAHLSTVRMRYQELLRDETVSRQMYSYATRLVELDGYPPVPANIKPYVDEMRRRVENAIHPKTASVRVIVDQDPTHVRLTRHQASAFIRSVTDPRDKAIVALLLTTGIRAAELVALAVGDLRSHMDDGALALHVRDGKGGKARKVPYGGNEGVLRLVDAWLAGRPSGHVFPSNGTSGHLTTRTVERVFENNQMLVNGEYVTLTPHDTRRSYARMQYVAGMDAAGIQQNLGHAEMATTLLYIGELDAGWRLPQAMLEFE
ncbi:tyrosine-type recombinase/integrase [Chloroflexota bacterium]